MRGLAAKTPRSLLADPSSAPDQPVKDGFLFHSTHTIRKRAKKHCYRDFSVTIQLLQLGHWGLPLECQDERVEKIVGLFAAGRKVGADDGKGSPPVSERKQPETFCLSLGLRRSRSAWLLSKRTRRSVRKRRTSLRCSRSRRMR